MDSKSSGLPAESSQIHLNGWTAEFRFLHQFHFAFNWAAESITKPIFNYRFMPVVVGHSVLNEIIVHLSWLKFFDMVWEPIFSFSSRSTRQSISTLFRRIVINYNNGSSNNGLRAS